MSSSSSSSPPTFQVSEKLTNLPVVPIGQNGNGFSHRTREFFDNYGRLTWSMDARGYITQRVYNAATGAMVRQVADVETATATGVPSGWTTPSDGGANLVTDYQHDDQGRILRILGPSHEAVLEIDECRSEAVRLRTVQFTVYRDDIRENWAASGYARGSGPEYTYVTTGPVNISRRDYNGRTIDQIQALRECDCGPLSSEESFPQKNWVRWSHNTYDAFGRLQSTRVYHKIPADGEGERGGNYEETRYGYDVMGRQNRVVSPGGTISRTVYDPRGLVIEQWVGTDDSGATSGDPSGNGASGNNMRQVSASIYDGDNDNDDGDSNLTAQRQLVDDTPANDRVTEFSYDYRNRRIDTTVTDGTNDFIRRSVYDNLDRVTGTDSYHQLSSGGSETLTGRQVTYLDNQGRSYKQEIYAVNPDSGVPSGKMLVGETWYDAVGNIVKSTQAGDESQNLASYDSMGRQTLTYLAVAPASSSSSSSSSSSGLSSSSSSSSGFSSSSSSSSSSFEPPVSSSSSSSSSEGPPGGSSSSSSSSSSEHSGGGSSSSSSSSSEHSGGSSSSSSSFTPSSSSSSSSSEHSGGSSSSSSGGSSSSSSMGPTPTPTPSPSPTVPPTPPPTIRCQPCGEEEDGGSSGSSPCYSGAPIRYSNGQIQMVENDLGSSAFGSLWGQTRSYANLLNSNGVGDVGNSWLVRQQVQLAFNAGENGNDIAAVIGANDSLWFQPDGSGGWEPKFTDRDVLEHDTVNHEFVLTNTRGRRWVFHDNSSQVGDYLHGKLKSLADPYGDAVTFSYNEDAELVRVEQSNGSESSAYLYSYYGIGHANLGMPHRITHQVNGVDVRQAVYEYYGFTDDNGSLDDLARVSIGEYDSSTQTWTTVRQLAYMYYKDSNGNGFQHGLKFRLSAEGYAQMVAAGLDPLTANDGALEPYSSHYFEYDSEKRVTREKVRGFSEQYQFDYGTNTADPGFDDYDTWATRTIETRPDNSTFTVYTTKAGNTLLTKFQEAPPISPSSSSSSSSSGDLAHWYSYNKYNSAGRVIESAANSAIASVSEPVGNSGSLSVTLRGSSGLIRITNYYTSTNTNTGEIASYRSSQGVKEGSGGTPEITDQVYYSTHTVDGVSIHPVSKTVSYPEAGGSGVEVSYQYAYYSEDGSANGFGSLIVSPGNDASDWLDDLKVIEQGENTYNEASQVTLATRWQRFEDAIGQGALNGPNDAEPKARRSYGAQWYDGIGRGIVSANYGTNGGATINRPSLPPERNETILVSSGHYNAKGELEFGTDPKGTVRRQVFDDMGRTVRTIDNYQACENAADASINRTTELTYNADGQVERLALVNPTTGNQVTRWVYGTTLSDSAVATNSLLRAKLYPNSDDQAEPLSDGPDDSHERIEYGYNRQGQTVAMTDPNGTVHEYSFDKLGRATDDSITTFGSSATLDASVQRLSAVYDTKRLLVSSVSSYDSASGGTVLNQVAYTYNDFGQQTADRQEHNGAVDGNTLEVGYTYEDGSRANTARRMAMTYPDGRQLDYGYGANGSTDDRLSRVASLKDNGETSSLVNYSYLGAYWYVEVDYPEPNVALSYQRADSSDPVGDAGDPYTGYDRFGRTVDMRWSTTDETPPTQLDHFQWGYDAASNRTWKANLVGTGQDEKYGYDGLYQVTSDAQGTLNLNRTAIGGIPAEEESFDYDATGNWLGYQKNEDGSSVLDQSRVNNRDNQVVQIDGSSEKIAYDRAGNATQLSPDASGDWDKSYTLVWDGWNRLVEVKDDSTPANTVASYAYDALARRITRTVSGTTTHSYYSDRWKTLEEREGTSTSAKTQYVWGARPNHRDELVLRDRDTTGGTPSELDERLYALMDYFNGTSIIDTNGDVQERYAFSAFGVRRIMAPDFSERASSNFDWEFGFQGQFLDGETGYINYGYRYYSPQLGRFINPDPIEEEGGTNLYAFVMNSPLNGVDWLGLEPNIKRKVLVIGGPSYNEDTGMTREASSKVFSEIGDRYSVDYDRHFVEIETHDQMGSHTGDPRLHRLTAMMAAYKSEWEKSVQLICCVDFSGIYHTGATRPKGRSKGTPITPEVLLDILLDPRAGDYDKIFILAHVSFHKDERGKNGIYMAAGTAPADPGRSVENEWTIGFSMDDLFGDVPNPMEVDIYTCYCETIPEKAGEVTINRHGEPDAISYWKHFLPTVIKPYVESECAKKSKPMQN